MAAKNFICVEHEGVEVHLPANFFSKGKINIRVGSTANLKADDVLIYRGRPKIVHKGKLQEYQGYERKANSIMDKGARCRVVNNNSAAKEVVFSHIN